MIRNIFPTKSSLQWTDRIAGLADESKDPNPEAAGSLAQFPTVSTDATVEAEKTPRDIPIYLRLEGPYFTPADPTRYNTVVCLVAGTGVSGAIAIAGAFRQLEKETSERLEPLQMVTRTAGSQHSTSSQELQSRKTTDRTWNRCIVVWSVREADYIEMPALKGENPPAAD